MAGGRRSLSRSGTSRSRRLTAAGQAARVPKDGGKAGRRYFPAAGARPAPIEKLKQKLTDLKQQSQEEKRQLADCYAQQIKELEEKFQKKVRVIGQIQLELKLINEFLIEKAAMEEELEDALLFWLPLLLFTHSSGLTVKPKITIEMLTALYYVADHFNRNIQKYTRVLATLAPAPDDTKEESKIGTENTSSNLIFIIQQAKLSDSSSSAVILPHIQMLTPQTEQGSSTLLREQQPHQLPTQLPK